MESAGRPAGAVRCQKCPLPGIAACSPRLHSRRLIDPTCFDIIPDSVLIHADARWVYANPAAIRMLGAASAHELLGRQITEFVPPELHASIVGRATAATGQPTGALEQRLLRVDGTPIDVEVSGAPIDLGSGRAALITVRDVSDRKRIERRYRSLVQDGTDLMFIADVNGEVTYGSTSVRTMLGYAPEEVGGLSLFAFVEPSELPAVVADFQRTMSIPGSRHSGRCHIRHVDGRFRLLDYTAVNMLHDPAVAGMVINARDVTDEVRLQSQLEQLQRVESLGRVAATITHEFNNVLMAVDTIALAIEKTAAAGPPSVKLLHALRSAVARGKRTTDEIRRFTHPSELHRERVAVARWLRAIEAELAATIAGHPLVLTLDEGLGEIAIDRAQMAQVLANLVINARDASREGVAIALEGRLADAAESEFGDVDLIVRDRGAGIPENVREQIFDPLFTTKSHGTGLGLSVVQQIVARHKGRLRIDTESGEGTTVTITLPAA